jgi:chromosome segregation ATPase
MGGVNGCDHKNGDQQLLGNSRVSSAAGVMLTPPPSDRKTVRDETPAATIVVENQAAGIIMDQKPLYVPAEPAKEEIEEAEYFERETTSITGKNKSGVQEVKVDAEAGPQEDPAEPQQDPEQELQKEEHDLLCISTETEIDIDRLRIELDTTRKNDAEKKMTALRKEIDTIKSKVVELSSDKKDTEEKMADLRNELNIAKSQVGELGADNDYVEEIIAELRKELNIAKSQVGEVSADKDYVEEIMADLRDENRKAIEEMDELVYKKNEDHMKILALNTKIINLRDEKERDELEKCR